jgi:hypothetical protein
MERKGQIIFMTLVVTLGIAALGFAGPIKRSNWVPNVGLLAGDEQPLGDLWTFTCPKDGTVSASVDTKDDLDTEQANLDPVLNLVDGLGNLRAAGDDEITCTFPPVCGFQCPQVVRILCGDTNPHSLIVRDYGNATITGDQCAGGGGYELTVTVFDSEGNPVEESKVALGGGPAGQVPAWALELGLGIAPVGPAVDNGNVPRFAVAESPSTQGSIESPGTWGRKKFPR